MNKGLKNLELLDPWVKKKVVPFCDKLLDALSSVIYSISIYGSVAVGEHIQKKSDINLIIIVDKLEMKDLQRCLKIVKWGQKRKISAPLVLTQRHIETSADTFPVEFLEMKEKHINIYGDDPFPDMVIDPKNLRLQCEQQIKGQLIRLRQSYLELGSKTSKLKGLLILSLTGLLPILRNTLRLIQPDSPLPMVNTEIIEKVGKEFEIDQQPFMDIWYIKRGLHRPNKDKIYEMFQGYLHNLTQLAKRIDELNI